MPYSIPSLFARALRAALIAIITTLAAAPSSRAAFTTILPPPHGEDSHERIFETLYGSDFSRHGVNYLNTSAAISAMRIDDSLPTPGVLGLVDGAPGQAADAVWHDGFVTAAARARFAGLSQSFGYYDGASGGSYVNLFNVTGSGYAVTGEASLIDMRGLTFRWVRGGGGTGPHSSLPSDNADGLDHLATYRVNGLADGPLVTTFLLFWEDRNRLVNQIQSDRDLNDLVIEIKAVGSLTNNVPEPAGLAMIALVLFGISQRRRFTASSLHLSPRR